MAVSRSSVDPLFAALAQQVYGPGCDIEQLWTIAKSMPGASDVSTPGGNPKKDRRLAMAGLATTGVAGVAGLHAIKATRVENAARAAHVASGAYEAPKMLGRLAPKKAAAVVGGGALALHGVELAADSLAARAAVKNLKKKPAATPVAKGLVRVKLPHVEPQSLVRADARARRIGTRLVGGGVATASAAGGYAAGRHTPLRRRPAPVDGAVAKGVLQSAADRGLTGPTKRSDKRNTKYVAAAYGGGLASDAAMLSGRDALERHLRKPRNISRTSIKAAKLVSRKGARVATATAGTTLATAAYAGHRHRKVAKSYEIRGTISKVDTDKRQVFGWANLAIVDGRPVTDLQGDYVPLEEIEKSAYSYMLTSRVGGHQHQRVSKFAGDVALHTSDIIESFVVTPEKLVAMGLAPDALPWGWWLGHQVNDETVWQKVKRGELTGMSIHGSGVRSEALV